MVVIVMAVLVVVLIRLARCIVAGMPIVMMVMNVSMNTLEGHVFSHVPIQPCRR